MSSEKTKYLYTLTTTNQLVDLNKDVTNFDCTFSIVSKDGIPFEAVVVSQSQLDSGDDFPFQQSNNGVFGGNVVMDKNTYQNFYLAMRASATNVVEVETDFKRLPDYVVQDNSGIVLEKSMQSDMITKILLACVGAIAVGGVVYMITNADRGEGTMPPTVKNVAPKESLLSTLKQVPIE